MVVMLQSTMLVMLRAVMHTGDMVAAVRKSVTLDQEDIHVVNALLKSGSPEQSALREVTGICLQEDSSETASIRALITAGRNSIEEKVLQYGYADYAATLDAEDEAAHRAMRRRHPLNRG